jgi:hypothetical protein
MQNRLDRLCDKSKGVEQEKLAMQAPIAVGLKRALGLSVALLGLVVAACATVTVESAPEVKQKVVAERSQARWQALMKGDLDAAYAFLSPASKKATPLAVYVKTLKPGMWRDVKVDKVDCEAELCKVQLAVTYDAKMMKGITTPIWESWIIEDGSAWYVYR